MSRRRKKHEAAYLDELPNAVEAIVRGVKSGLPLNDSMRLVAKEAKEPIKTEFQRVLDQQTMGKSTTEAVQILFDRMPLAEVNFFVVVITVQQQAGGNLSEALGIQGAAQPQEDEAEDQGDVLGSQGLCRHHRLAALRGRHSRDADHAELHGAALYDHYGLSLAGCCRRADEHRRVDHGQYWFVRLLRQQWARSKHF